MEIEQKQLTLRLCRLTYMLIYERAEEEQREKDLELVDKIVEGVQLNERKKTN